MVNRVILIGNLGKDPEVRRLESGAVVAKFSVATNESYKDRNGEWQQQTEWHDVVVWRALAERAEEQLKKGSQVYVEGKLTHRTWQDQDGNNRRTTEVVANYFRSLSRRDNVPEGYFPSEEDAEPYVKTAAPKAASSVTDNNDNTGFPDNEGPDDDLPF